MNAITGVDLGMGKLPALLDDLRGRGRVAVALSGGVDSAVLACAARLALGGNALAVTLRSEFTATCEITDAERSAEQIGIDHHVIDTWNLEEPLIAANGPDRCYHCKRRQLRTLMAWADEHACSCVAEGTNPTELATVNRPGWRAVTECGGAVASPLCDAGLTKAEIRVLAQLWGLDVWNKPSAGCLATRIADGQPLAEDALRRVEAAESCLRGLVSCHVRVRSHRDGVARIEVNDEAVGLVLRHRAEIDAELSRLGFAHVALDLRGYRRL